MTLLACQRTAKRPNNNHHYRHNNKRHSTARLPTTYVEKTGVHQSAWPLLRRRCAANGDYLLLYQFRTRCHTPHAHTHARALSLVLALSPTPAHTSTHDTSGGILPRAVIW